jgi:hypothetical protein
MPSQPPVGRDGAQDIEVAYFLGVGETEALSIIIIAVRFGPSPQTHIYCSEARSASYRLSRSSDGRRDFG